MRLIDADAMERLMSDTVKGDIRGYPYSDTTWETAFEWLDHQPAIDAVPVVRCGNCKYGRESNNFKGYFYCDKPFLPKGVAHNFNWYCPGGARKEDAP